MYTGISLFYTGDFYELWPANAEVSGKPLKFLNDLTIASDGTIYMTDSSAKWDRRHNRYCIFEGEATGRSIFRTYAYNIGLYQ